MWKIIKTNMKISHLFVPSRKNKYHPHILRKGGMFVVLMVLVFIPPLYNIIMTGRPQVLGYATNVNTTDIFYISNQQRTAAGLSPLTLDSQLVSAANAKANHMFANNYWAHIAPDGSTPWTFIGGSGYDYSTAGENLAKDFNTSNGVVMGWMGSAAHRENLLNSAFKDVGYAVVNGTLLGSQTTLVVAMYGAKVQPVVQAPVENKTEQPVAVKNPETPSQKTTTAANNQNTTSTEPATNTDNSTQQESPAVEQPVVATNTEKTTNSSDAVKNQTNVPVNKQAPVGAVEGAFITVPIKVYNSFNWGQKVSLLLVSTMILLFIMKHTLIWRHQKRGLRHIWMRAHPIGQAMVLCVTVIAIILNGVGVIL